MTLMFRCSEAAGAGASSPAPALLGEWGGCGEPDIVVVVRWVVAGGVEGGLLELGEGC